MPKPEVNHSVDVSRFEFGDEEGMGDMYLVWTTYLAKIYVRSRALAIFDYMLGARLTLNHDLGAGDGQHLVLHVCLRYEAFDGWNAATMKTWGG